MMDIPVIGITEAALHTACLLGGRCGAIVMSANSATILREMADAYGLGSRLGAIHTLPMTPLDLIADPAATARRSVPPPRSWCSETVSIRSC